MYILYIHLYIYSLDVEWALDQGPWWKINCTNDSMVCLGVPIPMTSPDDFRVCTFELDCVMQSKTFYQSMDQSYELGAGAQAFQAKQWMTEVCWDPCT